MKFQRNKIDVCFHHCILDLSMPVGARVIKETNIMQWWKWIVRNGYFNIEWHVRFPPYSYMMETARKKSATCTLVSGICLGRHRQFYYMWNKISRSFKSIWSLGRTHDNYKIQKGRFCILSLAFHQQNISSQLHMEDCESHNFISHKAKK